MNTSIMLDALGIETMHSGRSCLNLTACSDWESFPAYAATLMSLLSGQVTSRSDAMDVRVWEVIIANEVFFLAYDDFLSMIALESKSIRGDQLMIELEKTLAA